MKTNDGQNAFKQIRARRDRALRRAAIMNAPRVLVGAALRATHFVFAWVVRRTVTVVSFVGITFLVASSALTALDGMLQPPKPSLLPVVEQYSGRVISPQASRSPILRSVRDLHVNAKDAGTP
jgi:hypothetical protein